MEVWQNEVVRYFYSNGFSESRLRDALGRFDFSNGITTSERVCRSRAQRLLLLAQYLHDKKIAPLERWEVDAAKLGLSGRDDRRQQAILFVRESVGVSTEAAGGYLKNAIEKYINQSSIYEMTFDFENGEDDGSLFSRSLKKLADSTRSKGLSPSDKKPFKLSMKKK